MQLRRACAPAVAAASARTAACGSALERVDLRRRLAAIREPPRAARRPAAPPRPRGAAHRADARFCALAGRLENLSPLAVLGRGYAVCWNADRDRASSASASSVAPGDACT